ncbi:TRAP transporter solute receptor unknown substrate 4 [Paramagnetospirillum magnetotacticum MS-1]|uniref:TRAP-type C4-dicarboxylate transport system periplasmic component n=1 Tax=Paramagnetospirillum magnetotacticum MS-1 TaxID=272627 RepID=A0A0C2U824_PARME|nr:TRAP transporter substrate-binding protein DctP [Paramagnetospirillum magnetotacticum]KIL97607.1 TRAP transporter solute receptor unknown substrate 4 [Paramagnetospirillum magnetotacticum MS-1]
MKISRRQALAGLAGAPALLSFGRKGWAQSTTTLKISHQFPGGTIEQGDFRDRLCRLFAREVEKRTNGALKFEIYANSSLMKTNAQFSALRKGALDMSLYPIPYAGGEVHACNLGLMPCLVTSYEQGARWKTAPIGKAFSKLLEDKGVKFIAWVWQAGGIASRRTPVLGPADVKGLTIRGGSRETDMMFAAAGAKVSTMPSNEIYIGMQTSALDAAVTSSTSLISFRLEELAKSLTAPRKGSFWFMLEPLLMSKAVFDTLPAAQQQVLLEVGSEMEAWGMAEAKKDDEQVAAVYGAKGCQVVDFTNDHLAQWRKIAEESAWADYAAKSPEAAELLKLARDVT